MFHLSRPFALASSLLLVGLPLATFSGDAEACGGTFCDQSQNNMPVDQTGETILFVLADDHTEAHIQIEYDPETDAEKFGWIVPVTALPEFEVASQQLFINLLNGSVPVYGFVSQVEPCGYGVDADSASASATCSDPGSYSSGGSDDTAGSSSTTDDGPEVLLRTTVGAFDVVVLTGEDASVVMEWLGNAGYYQDPAAEPILQEYLDDDYLFAAFKLTQGAGIAEIHPVTLRYPGNEPCVPIKLTRIAAQDNMDIRTLFLGAKGRVGPSNYLHVTLNEVQLDWPNFADNYKEVVSLAVDAKPANGHAFVTEYAGSSKIVSKSNLHSDAWDHTAFAGAKPVSVVDLLTSQGLMECNGARCVYNHPLIQGLLYQYLPIPGGLEEGDFYSCLECYEGMIDVDAYDAQELSLALLERVIEPGLHALDLLDTWPYLTRLYTTMSPSEMTEDPFFHENTYLPDLDQTSMIATQFFPCDGAPEWTLPGGFQVPGNFAQTWPEMPEEMPWAHLIELIPPIGPPQVEVDNTQLISMLLGTLKVDPGVKKPRDCHGTSGPETESSSSGSGQDSSASSSATGGFDDEGSCACRSDGGAPIRGGALALLTLGLLRRRRRN